MLVRAWDLRDTVSAWLERYRGADSALKNVRILSEEWQQVQYLIVLLRPFFEWTDCLSRSSRPIIGKAWATYTSLFKHLEDHDKLLRQKSEPWNVGLADSVSAAHRKLAEYYSRTDGQGGTIFNLACVLDPMQKLDLYRSPAFEARYASIYETEFRTFYRDNYSHLENEPDSVQQAARGTTDDFVSLAIAQHQASKGQKNRFSGLNQYLQSETTDDVDILSFWRDYEQRAPGLAQMAKDILAVPIAGVGVERHFSIARHIC